MEIQTKHSLDDIVYFISREPLPSTKPCTSCIKLGAFPIKDHAGIVQKHICTNCNGKGFLTLDYSWEWRVSTKARVSTISITRTKVNRGSNKTVYHLESVNKSWMGGYDEYGKFKEADVFTTIEEAQERCDELNKE